MPEPHPLARALFVLTASRDRTLELTADTLAFLAHHTGLRP